MASGRRPRRESEMKSENELTFCGHAVRAVLALAGLALFAAHPLSAQSLETNFFVAAEGPACCADSPPVRVSDRQCRDLAYAAGMGDGRWRAYMTGRTADGEGDEIARERIGTGPWYNYYGVMIAENLDQLHSDEAALNRETAVTERGEYAPEDFEIPSGSQLNGTAFTREGPYFCFKLPG
jgi:hypothetical protein